MHRYILSALLFSLVILCACHADEEHGMRNDIRYPAANLDDDNYDPGPGRDLVWSDEFKGTTLDPDNWVRQVVKAGRFNGEWQRYTDSVENAYIEDDCLVIKAIHEGDVHASDQYTSARLHSVTSDAWQYGKIAARIQLPYGKGIWPAFWMLGANIAENGGDTPWPQSGEIDILEMYGSRNNGRVEANIHYANRKDRHESMGAESYTLEDGWFADAFHVFEIEWDEEGIEWFVDGRKFASTSISGDEFSEFHKPFFILLNIAVGGRAAGAPEDSTVLPQVMYVDWVRVYQ